jgi:hypothetical protein
MTPWFAKHFSCAGVPSPDGSAPCRINVNSGWNGPTGGEVGYGAALQYCAQSHYESHWSDDWDSPYCDVPGTAVAKVFDLPQQGKQGAGGSWQRCPWAIEGQNKSWWHRVYYEDPKSLALKYALATGPAAEGVGNIGGFGMWCASAAITAMGPQVAADMWKAVPAMSRAETVFAKTDDDAPPPPPPPATRLRAELAAAQAKIHELTAQLQLHHAPPPPPPPPDARVLMNPLKGLRPLQKVHYSWPFGWDLQHGLDPDPNYAHGIFHDYARIAGALPYGLADLELRSLNATARICEAVTAPRVAAGLPPAVVTLNFSPWYEKFKGNDPNDDGPQEKAELSYLESLLSGVTRDMKSLHADVEVGAVLFDSEKFAATPANRAAVIRKHDLVYNLTRKYLPHARIELYGRGTMGRSDNWNSYCAPPQEKCSVPASPWWMRTSYTLGERGESLAVSLYTAPELWEMRAIMAQTVALAREHNASGQLSGGVTPWISLGAGYRREPNRTLGAPDISYKMQWDFDRVYSWQLGAELNIPWWGSPEREAMTAPWGVAQVVVLYPSAFNPDSAQAGPANRSTIAMQHFVNYVRGANGLEGIVKTDDAAAPRTEDRPFGGIAFENIVVRSTLPAAQSTPWIRLQRPPSSSSSSSSRSVQLANITARGVVIQTGQPAVTCRYQIVNRRPAVAVDLSATCHPLRTDDASAAVRTGKTMAAFPLAGVQCLNGLPPVVWVNASAQVTDWVIQIGGQSITTSFCISQKTCTLFATPPASPPPPPPGPMPVSNAGPQSDDCTINPSFCGFNQARTAGRRVTQPPLNVLH